MKKNKLMTLIVLLMVIGFATITTTLIINGGANLLGNQDEFANDILFTKAETEDGGSADITDAGKSITYSTKEMYKLNDLAKLDFEITNFSKQYDAVATIECTLATDNDLTDHVEIRTDKNSYEINAQETVSGYVETKLIKSYAEENEAQIEFSCELIVSAKERDSKKDNNLEKEESPASKSYRIIDDVNKNWIADIGDEIAIGDEHFYVISNDGITLNALAKYNLYAGGKLENSAYVPYGDEATGIQSKLMVDLEGAVVYSNAGASYEGSNAKAIVDKYVLYLEEISNVNISGSLLTEVQFQNIIKHYDTSISNLLPGYNIPNTVPSWLGSTTYWMNQFGGKTGENVYSITHYSDESLYYSGTYYNEPISNLRACGVRPVIEIDA